MTQDLEERAVSTEELHEGVKLAAGHAVVLIVGGGQAKPSHATATTETESAAAGAGSDVDAPAPAAAKPSAGWATGAAAMSPPPRVPGAPASRPPSEDAPGKIHTCQFQDGMELDGDTAWLAAQCGGLEGQQVQFVLESEEGGEWRPVASGVSTVKAGHARSGIAISTE
ncbi:MAG: hypothetical protein ABR567_04420 [Myxococcales bacterium]|nr:hypothetical protein [Myxococcales bacterium]